VTDLGVNFCRGALSQGSGMMPVVAYEGPGQAKCL